MKKPALRCLTNPNNLVPTFRFTELKYERLECHSCKGSGLQIHEGVVGKCWLCKGVGKISLRVGV